MNGVLAVERKSMGNKLVQLKNYRLGRHLPEQDLCGERS